MATYRELFEVPESARRPPGVVAQWLAVPVTMTLAAAASVTVTLALTPGLRWPAEQTDPAPDRQSGEFVMATANGEC
ncbi:MAG TPA: hypothetical protein VGM53_15570 [Streptosporangiaceae bacterium]